MTVDQRRVPVCSELVVLLCVIQQAVADIFGRLAVEFTCRLHLLAYESFFPPGLQANLDSHKPLTKLETAVTAKENI